MARYLVIAHQTADSPELLDCLRDLAAADQAAEFALLVPATPVCNTWVCDEIETERVARARADEAGRQLRRAGLNLTTVRTGDGDPIEALRDELNDADGYQTVVISTLPPGISRWLKMDVPARAQRLLKDRDLITVISQTVAVPVDADMLQPQT